MNKKPVCFISYSRKDLTKATRICNLLSSANVDVRIDRNDIVGGESWKHALYDLVRTSDVLVFLMSPLSVQSQWCLVERCLADYDGKAVITVIMETCVTPVDVQHLQHIDLSPDPRKNMPALISAIHFGVSSLSTPASQRSDGGETYHAKIHRVDNLHMGRKVTKD